MKKGDGEVVASVGQGVDNATSQGVHLGLGLRPHLHRAAADDVDFGAAVLLGCVLAFHEGVERRGGVERLGEEVAGGVGGW